MKNVVRMVTVTVPVYGSNDDADARWLVAYRLRGSLEVGEPVFDAVETVLDEQDDEQESAA